MYVDNNPVSNFIVLVSDFIVGFPTLLLLDNNIYTSLIVPYSTVTDLARFLG